MYIFASAIKKILKHSKLFKFMSKFLLLAIFACSIFTANSQKTYKYSIAPKDSVVDIYFSDTIFDPYQWMENPSDPRLKDWIDDQKKLTEKLGHKQTQIWTLREQIATMYSNIEREKIEGYVEKEEKNKDRYEFKDKYIEYNRAPDLLYKKNSDSNYKYLIKIKEFRNTKDDNVIITNIGLSPDFDIAAISMSHSGSDWREVYFFDLENGQQLSDTLKYLRNGSQVIWNGNGVYYDSYKKPVEGRELLDKAVGQTLYYHKIGTTQSNDLMLYQNPDTTGAYRFRYFKQDSTKLFFYHQYQSKGKIYNAVSYGNINENKSVFLKNFLLYPKSDSIGFKIEELFGDTAILSTTWDTPNGKLMTANINQLNSLEKLVPEFDVPMRSANRLGKDMIACTYRNDGQYFVLIFNLQGELLKKIDFPFGKSVKSFYENDPEAEYTDFCISSFYHPNIWYQLSLKDFSFKPISNIWIPYDAKKLETRYIKYISKDGTEIPMYITCLKDTKLNGNNPTLLYGYGGYGVTIEPFFNESVALWLLHGGILAVPNIRGGGDEGSEWGKAGRRLKKQNTFNDFIAAAEYLIQEKYTNPDKLAIRGKSHGGLLVTAVAMQRPELFKAVVAEAGVYDMLRFEKFTIGSADANVNEFGSVTNFYDYNNLKSYSPLHNIRDDEKYPNILLLSGDNDDRVPSFHSYKFLATLQARGSSKSVYQLYIIPGAGHGGALTPVDAFEKLLYEYYFLFDQLGIEFW